MVNHPNRSKRNPSPFGNPSPNEIREARDQAGLSQQEAATVTLVADRTWQYWEAGERRMPPFAFELFQLKTGQIPLQIVNK